MGYIPIKFHYISSKFQYKSHGNPYFSLVKSASSRIHKVVPPQLCWLVYNPH